MVVAFKQHVQTIELGVYVNGFRRLTPTENVDQTTLRAIYIINLHLVAYGIRI